MAKPHAKTLQERMGLVEGDLKTPGHDAIMYWLDEQIKVSLSLWLNTAEWNEHDRSHGLDLPEPRLFNVTKTIWEHPVITGREYTVGFIDLFVEYRQQHVSWTSPYSRPNEKTWSVDWETYKAFFEVKTVIPSLGELLRQLNQYKMHLKSNRWEPDSPIFVVCPDVRFADKIREQGFGFIQVPADIHASKTEPATEPDTSMTVPDLQAPTTRETFPLRPWPFGLPPTPRPLAQTDPLLACNTCWSTRLERQPSGRMVCLDCLGVPHDYIPGQ